MGEQSARIGLGRLARACATIAVALLLANCAAGTGQRAKNTNYSPKVVADGEPVPRGGGTFKLGNPYTINGRTYYPAHDPAYRAEGIASWYGRDFHGRQTANGEVYDMNAISAAHPTMPLPSYARVTNLENGRSIIVRVNDRGPVCPQPDHRSVDRNGEGARQLRAGAGAGPGRICRPRRDCGQRRRGPAGEPTAWQPGARAIGLPAGDVAAHGCGQHARSGRDADAAGATLCPR